MKSGGAGNKPRFYGSKPQFPYFIFFLFCLFFYNASADHICGMGGTSITQSDSGKEQHGWM